MSKNASDRRQNVKVALGWSFILGLIVLAGVCCAPMARPSWPTGSRGAYVPLSTARIGDGGIAISQCSWGRVDEGTVVTAAHCVGDSQGFILPGMPSAPAVCVDAERDAAYLSVGLTAPPSRVEAREAEPEAGDQVCYDSFRGRHNCGTVTRVFSDRFTVRFQAEVRPGDSGSPVYSPRGVVGVVSRRMEGEPIGVAARLPRRCK